MKGSKVKRILIVFLAMLLVAMPLAPNVVRASTEITTINITGVKAPQAGEIPDFSGITTDTTGVKIDFDNTRYAYLSDGGSYFGHDSSVPFQNGKQYCISIGLDPEAGYSFAARESLNVTINGQPASEVGVSGHGDTSRYVRLVFPKLEGTTPKCTVSHDLNGGSGYVDKGSSYTLPANSFTAPAGKEFKAWEVKGVTYNMGDYITVTEDTVVKALWADGIEINQIAINGVTDPIIGALPTTDGITVETANVKMDPRNTKWSIYKSGSQWGMGPSEQFAEGEKSIITVSLEADAGYYFADEISATINGRAATKIEKVDVNLLGRFVKYEYAPLSAGGSTPIEKVTVTFDAGGGTGTMADVIVDKGSSYTLPANSFTAPAGKEFKAWDVGGVEKTVGDNITVDADTTVTALWKDSGTLEEDPTEPTTPTKPVTSTITVDPAGGTWSDNTTAAKTYVMNVGEKFTLPAAPTKTGITFVEWQGSRYQPGDQYTVTDQDHTFTAVWKANPTTPTDQTTPPNLAALPKTGEQGSMVFWVGLMLLASAGLLLLARKKVNNKK